MSEHEPNNETIAWKAEGDWRDDPRVTAYALGELEALDEETVAAIAAQLARDPELRQYVEDLRATGETLCVELGATESSAAHDDQRSGGLSAEALMAAAFKDESHTQTVSAVAEKPHAAAGSGRRAREASKLAPSPFRRYVAFGAAAAMLVISVGVGLMVANYGAQSPATPVAAEVQEPPKVAEIPYREKNNLTLDAALELQIGQYKESDVVERIPEDQRDRMVEEYRDPELERFQNPVPTVAAVKEVLGSVPDMAGAEPNSGGIGYLPANGPDAQRGPVLQRRNMKISELLKEVDRVTDENLKLGEVDTKLSWAPERLKSGLVYQQDRGANSQTVPFDSAHSFDLQINGPPNTIDGTNRAIDGTMEGAIGLAEVADDWADSPRNGKKDEVSRGMTRWPGNMPPATITGGFYRVDPRAKHDGSSIPLDLGLPYGDASRRAGPPFSDSSVASNVKSTDKIAEAIMVADASKAEAKRAEEITKLHRVLVKSQQGVALDAQDQILEKDLDDLRMRLKERQKENQARGITEDPIATANIVIADKYGPNVISEKKPEVAETKKAADAPQPEKPNSPVRNDSLKDEIEALKKQLKEMSERHAQQKNQDPAITASIGTTDTVFENAYGPNAGVTTKDDKLTMGGLLQVYYFAVEKEKAATGLSQVTGEWVDGTLGDPSGSGITIDGEHNDDNLSKTQVLAGGINYYLKGHNAKLAFKDSTAQKVKEVYLQFMDIGVDPEFLARARVGEEGRPSADQFHAYHGIVPHHDFHVFTGYRLAEQHWADQFRRYFPLEVTEMDGPTRGLWIRGEWSGLRPPAAPAPEAPGGMVVWHFNAADPARGQTNDMWRLTRVGGRFSDLMSSIDDYRIGGAVKDGGLALVGVDGEFDHGRMGYVAPHPDEGRQTESYAVVNENPFEKARTISTFSIDVDTASYSNVRRWLNDNQLPPPGAVRYEELINYFRYAYEPPPSDAKEPFATHVEVATCPWNAAHRLVRIALKGREIDPNSRPSSNLVFLVDVSGSMSDANKLGLVQQGLRLLVDNLNARDHVAIVTYAGAAGVALKSTSCDQKIGILNAINNLNAGGSTNGAQGIITAYELAQKGFIKGGTNRVILCTDGDFNVGTTSNDELVKLIEKQAKSGVFLSVLGFGMGNLKDDKLEAIADKGNGHYAYIDSFQEAKKVFGRELAGTLVTIAKDVKVQVEFNPAAAHSYRLIGYENRLMRKEDFADDTKDAGEIGAGHAVTALYEVIPAGAEEAVQPVRVPLDVLLLNAKPEEVAKLAFIWKQTGGPKADLRDADRPNAYFLPTADGEYEFEVSAIADASVIKTTVKRTVKLADLAAPKASAERPSRYLEEAKVKEDAKTSGELLTVWLRYKQPEEDKSTELGVPVRDGGKKLEQSSPDFRFASSVAAFGMLLRGSVYAKNLNWDFVLELAGESKGADAEGQRTEFIDLAKKAKALSGK